MSTAAVEPLEAEPLEAEAEDQQDEKDVASEGGISTDLVRAYLKEIGKTPLLTAAQEVQLSQRIEAGLFANHKLAQPKLSPALRRDLEWVAAESGLPIVLKGILTREDALLAVEHGAAAVWVSNHGGRQLDGVAAGLDALPEVVEAVNAGFREGEKRAEAAGKQIRVGALLTAMRHAARSREIAELAVHTWDIARATGKSEDLDASVAEYGLVWAKQNLRPQFRGPEDEGKGFGPEVPVPDDAPIYERLAGWFGRDPQWSGKAT